MTGRLKAYLPPTRCIVLGSMLFSAGCTRTMGPKGLSDATYVATQRAVDALEGASQDRNSSASIFDPKLQAATRAADEVYNAMGNESADGYAVTQIRTCIEELKAYRANFDSRESASRPIEEQLKGIAGTQVKDANDVVSRNSKELDECVKEAKAFL